MVNKLSTIWKRYLAWRNTMPSAPDVQPELASKIAIDQDALDRQTLALSFPKEG